MSARGYGEPVGGEYGSGEGNRDRWRERDERSGWRGEQRGRDEDRGFFERAGDEIRSWFGDDDDESRRGRDFDRGGGNLREQQRHGRGGWGGQDWERERSHGGGGRDRGEIMREQRSSFGGMAQSGVSSRGDWQRGPERESGSWADRDRYRENRPMQRGGRGDDFGRGGWGGQRSERGGHAQSWGEANRGESGESLGYSEFGGMLGGFGNQRFASSQDELYRRWRDRQMEQLDREYEDYCRDCEQKFHQDFDSWRRSRQGQTQGQAGERETRRQGQTQGSDELILGGGSTSDMSASSGSTTANTAASDTTGSTEMAGAGGTSDSELGTGSGSGRSGSRSRS